MLKKITITLMMAMVASQVQARGVDLRLADETAEMVFLTESSTFGYGGADVGLGFFFNEADDVMFSASAMVTGHGAGNNRALQFGVGAKFMMPSLDFEDEVVAGLAIGGQIRYVIPATTPIALLAEGFIAPKIVSFSGAEQLSEYRFALELEVTPSARAYVGFRHFEVDLENGPTGRELDDEAHIGIRIQF